MKNLGVVVAAGFLVVSVVSGQSGVRRLDLTRPEVVKTRPTVSGGSVSGFSGVVGPALPLAVRLVSVDRRSYRPGDPIVYQVEVANSGAAAFGVPTSLDHRAFEHLDDVSTTLTLVLEVLVGDKSQSIAAFALVGAASEPGSMQSLGPGDKLLITAPSEVFRQPSPLLKAPGEYSVRARVDVADRANHFLPAFSENQLAITLQLAGRR